MGNGKWEAKRRIGFAVWFGLALAALVLGLASRSVGDEPGARLDEQQWKEVARLSAAMETFKEKFVRLPPSVAGGDRLRRFVHRTFPRAVNGGLLEAEKLDAAKALPFWLTQISTDPRRPFSPLAKPEERYIFYGFAEKRLKDGRYFPTSDDKADPYVYFSADCYAESKYENFEPYYLPDAKRKGVKHYLAPETCQIIGPGKDGKLGRGGSLAELSEEDRDNVVSFAKVVVGEIDVEELAAELEE